MPSRSSIRPSSPTRTTSSSRGASRSCSSRRCSASRSACSWRPCAGCAERAGPPVDRRVAMKLGVAYTAGRVCAVATRPLCLFLANNLLATADAQGLAVVFLASALSLIGVAADPHRRFYARLFDPHTATNGYSAYLFFASLAILQVVGYGAAFVVTWHFTASVLLGLVAGA